MQNLGLFKHSILNFLEKMKLIYRIWNATCKLLLRNYISKIVSTFDSKLSEFWLDLLYRGRNPIIIHRGCKMILCSHKVCNLRDQVRTNLPAHMYLINWSQDQTMRVHLFENFSTLLWNKLQILFHSPQLSELFKDFDHKSPIRIFFHWLQSILNVCVWILCVGAPVLNISAAGSRASLSSLTQMNCFQRI
jgi:hypothetical protein